MQFPLVGIALVLFESAGMSTDPASAGVMLINHVLQLVVGALTIPFTAGVTALLYLDQRIRREGLDVTLVHAAQARAAERAG